MDRDSSGVGAAVMSWITPLLVKRIAMNRMFLTW